MIKFRHKRIQLIQLHHIIVTFKPLIKFTLILWVRNHPPPPHQVRAITICMILYHMAFYFCRIYLESPLLFKTVLCINICPKFMSFFSEMILNDKDDNVKVIGLRCFYFFFLMNTHSYHLISMNQFRNKNLKQWKMGDSKILVHSSRS